MTRIVLLAIAVANCAKSVADMAHLSQWFDRLFSTATTTLLRWRGIPEITLELKYSTDIGHSVGRRNRRRSRTASQAAA
jgi:hypothetical protein